MRGKRATPSLKSARVLARPEADTVARQIGRRTEPSRAAWQKVLVALPSRIRHAKCTHVQCSIVSGCVVLAAWEGTTRLLSIPEYLVPAPTQIVQAIVAQRDELVHHALLTTIVMAGGFILGSIFSVSLACLIVYWSPARRLIMPYMVLVQTMPKIALAPLFIIWLGFGIMTNVIFTALIAFFPVLVNFVQGLDDVDVNELRLMTSYDASRWHMFRHVQLYRALPYLFAGLKLAAVLALIGAVVSEYVMGDGGLGYYMIQAQSLLQTKEAFAALIILSLMGLLSYFAIDLVQRRVAPWAHTKGGDQDVI